MKLSLVVAVAENGVIGREGGLPWRLSTDLKRFKTITMGKPVIMGRKTWESIGKPLPGRLNVVVTHDETYRAERAILAGSLENAIRLAETRSQGEEICVIGGGEIFREALEQADTLYVTHVEADVEGDVFFPDISPDIWMAAESEWIPAGERDDHPTRYVIYRRRAAT